MVITILALIGVAFSNSIHSSGILKPGMSPKTLTKSNIHSVLMTNEDDTYYVVKVTIGSPPVTFNLAVDTGSNVTWVLSNACANCFNTSSSYNPTKSTTSALIYPMGVARYEDGSYIAGPGYSDEITISGLTANVTFLAATTTSLHWTGFNADGVLGLGYTSSTKGSPSIINALATAGLISSPTFSLFYADDLFIGQLKPTMTLGSADFASFAKSSALKNAVTVTTLNSNTGLWQFESSNIVLGNTTVSGSVVVSVDSAQEWIFVSQESYNLVETVLMGAGFSKSGWFYSKPCNTSSGYPTLFIGYNYTTYLQIPSYRYLQLSGKKGNFTCYANIFQSSDNSWYLGDSLFRTYYSTFYTQNSSIVFTQANWEANIKYKHHSSSSDDDGMAGWLIAVIVICCILGVVAIGAIVWFVMKKKRHGHVDSMGKPLQEVSLHA